MFGSTIAEEQTDAYRHREDALRDEIERLKTERDNVMECVRSVSDLQSWHPLYDSELGEIPECPAT